MTERQSNANLAESLFVACVQGIGLALAGGSGPAAIVMKEVGGPFARAAWRWLSQRPAEEQQQAIDGLANMPTEVARRIARDQAERLEVAPDRVAALSNYMAVVPMTTRRAIARVNDQGLPQTLLSQLPRREIELTRFIPLRPPLFQAGDRVPGRDYILERLVGQGGFGEVWVARHEYNPADVRAYKFCSTEGEEASRRIATLRNEMNLVNQLHGTVGPHEGHAEGQINIVRLLETGLGSSPPFVAYEYIDGGDLVAWRASFGQSAPPAADVAQVLRMIARALAFAHGRGVVHRDLKPANVLVTRDGVVKLTDFGIGKQRPSLAEEIDSAVTQASAFHGANTPAYADPFHAQGPDFDVYSVGVIGYQLLVGDVTRTVTPSLQSELESLAVPEWLIHVLLKCLDIPSKRFRDGSELLAALRTRDRQPTLDVVPPQQTGAGSPRLQPRGSLEPVAQRPDPPVPGPRPTLTRRQQIALGAVLLAALGIGIGTRVPDSSARGSPADPAPPVPSAPRVADPSAPESSADAEATSPAPPAPEPPRPGCVQCANGACPHFQIATGQRLGALIEAAERIRTATPTAFCAEVYEVARPPGSFVLTLGHLEVGQGQQALQELQHSGVWSSDQGFAAPGSTYGQRIYPPPCAERPASTGKACQLEPPAAVQIQGSTLRWLDGAARCECNAVSGWLEGWRELDACVASCRADGYTPPECALRCRRPR